MYDSFYQVVLPQPEIWKKVVGFEDSHEVSNYGNVRSIERVVHYTLQNGSSRKRTFPSKTLKHKIIEDGYVDIHLRSQGKNKHWRLHKIVSEAFHNVEDGTVVDHKNDLKDCNVLWNLKRCDVSYNTKKASEEGSNRTGNKVYAQPLSDEVKQQVRDLLQTKSIRAIAREVGISQRSIARIRDGLI